MLYVLRRTVFNVGAPAAMGRSPLRVRASPTDARDGRPVSYGRVVSYSLFTIPYSLFTRLTLIPDP